MKGLLKVMVLAVGILSIGALSAWAEETETKTLLGDVLKDKGIDIAVTGTTDVFSKYVWRGFLLDDDWVVQPAVTFASGGFQVGVWGNFDAEQDDALASNEIDTWASYSYTIDDMVTLKAGHTYYEFVQADSFSKEWFVGVGLNTILAPTLTAYFDYGNESQGGGDGEYYALDVSHSFTLVEDNGITLDLGAHAGYNHDLFIVGDGFDALFSAGLGVLLTENLKASLKGAYSVPFEDLEDAALGNQDEEFYGGVSLAYSF